MSHFVSLLENALKAGNVEDPVFRERVYRGALKAFDKMSDERPDRAEFRKLHGPQLADAITLVEQRYVVLEDEGDGVLPADPGFASAVSREPEIEEDFQNVPPVDGDGLEPAVAEIDDDIFVDGDKRPSGSKAKGSGISRLILLVGIVVVFLLVGLLIWIIL